MRQQQALSLSDLTKLTKLSRVTINVLRMVNRSLCQSIQRWYGCPYGGFEGKVNRWYAYAALILLGVSAYQWLDYSLPFSFIIPGSAIILTGLGILIRFLRDNPKLTEERVDDNR